MAHEDGTCLQAVPIAKLESATEQIVKTLEKLGNVLEKIAEQGVEVNSLKNNQEILFEQNRQVLAAISTMNTKIAVEETKIGFIVTGIAAAVSALTTFCFKYFSK